MPGLLVLKKIYARFVMTGRKKRKTAGQTTVELLLILPVFFLVLFAIMEIGNIAFQVITANHAAYELARLGSLTAGPPEGSVSSAVAKMNRNKDKMFPNPAGVFLSARSQVTANDPQWTEHVNRDLVVTLKYRINLVFPISRYLMSKPLGSGGREITIKIRMPIESPVH